ncbi:MAG TPA: hypothetical protein VGE64_05530 [Xanthomonadaceae bacterium]
MKNAGITVILIGAAVAGFAGYEGFKWLAKQNQPTAADVTKEVDALRAEAAQKHPGMSQTDAMKEVAAAKAGDMMRKASPGERAQMAANVFYGSYFMNTRVRPAWCRQRGVDIAPFASAYERAHGAELSKAKAAYAGTGRSPEEILAIVEPELRRMVEQDMKDVGNSLKLTPEKTCTAFNENADAFARAIQLPPEIRQALLAS